MHEILWPLKDIFNILYNQNILQQKQIIEVNSLFECDHANRLVINELNIEVATLNKTMMAVIGQTKFIKFTVAALTDMRMTTCTAIFRINEFTREC